MGLFDIFKRKKKTYYNFITDATADIGNAPPTRNKSPKRLNTI